MLRDPDPTAAVLDSLEGSEKNRTAARDYAGAEWATLVPGSHWIYEGQPAQILSVTSLETVLIKCMNGACVEVPRIHLCAPPVFEIDSSSVEHADEAAIGYAKAIEAAVAPYAEGQALGATARRELATRFEVDAATIKRWVRKYRTHRYFGVFLPRKPGPKPGGSKLLPEIEAILTRAIEDHLKHHDDITVNAIFDRVEQHCRAIRAPAPSLTTIQKRIAAAKKRADMFAPHLRELLEQKSAIVRGSLAPTRALEIAQVDHTVVDIAVNDPVTGQCIGRPLLTIVFDVRTRVVLGICLTLEAPSQLSVALALHRAVFPKERWLEEIGAVGPWPFFGMMQTLHTDNASEFQSPHYKSAAKRWNIDVAYRVKGQPQHGAHIERFLGTLMSRIHGLRGASYSRVLKQRMNTGKSEFTLASLERWITNEITAYHHEEHRGLGMSPAQAWEQVWTTEAGLTLPVYPRDEREFLVSFLPGEMRTITRAGIEWKGLQYRCEALQSYIRPGVLQRFRYDKRDVSQIYFVTPDSGYIEVPWIHCNFPRMSLWEWDEVRPRLRVPARLIDREAVHRAREANRLLIQQQAGSSQRARRRQSRESDWTPSLDSTTPGGVAPLQSQVVSANTILRFEILE